MVEYGLHARQIGETEQRADLVPTSRLKPKTCAHSMNRIRRASCGGPCRAVAPEFGTGNSRRRW